MPAAALAHLAEFRLEPVEENTATRVPERARVGMGQRFREMRASLGPPTDRSLHMTVRATDELSTQPRATQRGAQDVKILKNTFLETSPRCAALTAAPSPSCGTCASDDVVLFAAAAPHQPSRSAARARTSMACGTRRCGRRGSDPGRAAWVRHVLAAARRRGKPRGGSALGRRTDTNQTNKQTHEPLCARARAACPRCCASRRRHWSASVH